MDFTREPIVESVVTPKEGCRLVIRSSKGVSQEEFFVDSVEIVSFGGTFFLRSLEKPKSFLVPATDYEILEVRETRMVLKNVGLERAIKIGGGRETPKRPAKEAVAKPEAPPEQPQAEEKDEPKKRERRRSYRKRREKEGTAGAQASSGAEAGEEMHAPRSMLVPPPETYVNLEKEGIGKPISTVTGVRSSLLPPPPTLISESIERYKGNELFKNVFLSKEESVEVKKPEAEMPEASIEEIVEELKAVFWGDEDLLSQGKVLDKILETEQSLSPQPLEENQAEQPEEKPAEGEFQIEEENKEPTQ